jgi:hypothetical protein
VKKYDNFVVEVDSKRKYVLQVTRALYQDMPVYNREPQEAEKVMTKAEIEGSDDFKSFLEILGKPIEML